MGNDEIGISLYNNQGMEDVHALVGLAVQAETLGFDLSGSTTTCSTSATCSSGSAGGRTTSPGAPQLRGLAHKRVRLGTSVLVLTYNNPIRRAKTAATLDV